MREVGFERIIRLSWQEDHYANLTSHDIERQISVGKWLPVRCPLTQLHRVVLGKTLVDISRHPAPGFLAIRGFWCKPFRLATCFLLHEIIHIKHAAAVS